MKSDAGIAVVLLGAVTLAIYVLAFAPRQEFERCEPPPWPADWPKPHVTVEHETGWVCQYGQARPGTRYGWTVCMRWTPKTQCEIFKGVNVRGDRL